MKMTPEEYNQLAKDASPKSPFVKNFFFAFLIGGLICALGEALRLIYLRLGLSLDAAATLVSVSLIFLSVLLTGLGIYDNLAKIGGAGTLVPITGFANSVASPSLEFKSEGLIMGLAAKMFIIAGPVIVYGISSSIVYGLIIWIFKLY